MRAVLDASAALSFVLHDEHDERAEFLLDAMRRTSAVVPAIWPAEVANGLVSARKRQRIDRRGIERAVRLLGNLDIEVDRVDCSIARIITLAEDHHLTAYDAVYLELALREDIRLASNDRDLMAAAKSARVALM